jgi:outer membrane biosynthesis protein TonB
MDSFDVAGYVDSVPPTASAIREADQQLQKELERTGGIGSTELNAAREGLLQKAKDNNLDIKNDLPDLYNFSHEKYAEILAKSGIVKPGRLKAGRGVVGAKPPPPTPAKPPPPTPAEPPPPTPAEPAPKSPTSPNTGVVIEAKPKYGPFHRIVNREEIELVEKTGQVKGRPPHNYYQSDIPKVQAHTGELPPRIIGYEFYTDVPPDTGSAPGGAAWSGARGDDWHSIDVTITKVQK